MTKRPKVQSEVGAPTKMSVKKELILIPGERVIEVTLQDMLYSIQMRSSSVYFLFNYNEIPKCHSENKNEHGNTSKCHRIKEPASSLKEAMKQT